MRIKYIAYLLLLNLSFTTYADVLETQGQTCSFRGTDVIFINGILTNSDAAFLTIDEISFSISNDLLEERKILPKPYAVVSYIRSYNHTKGAFWDLHESTIQKLKNLTGLTYDQAYTFTFYYYTTQKRLTESFLAKITGVPQPLVSLALTILTNLSTKENSISLSESLINQHLKDTTKLKRHLADSLLNYKKVVLISHSQGNLFANDVIKDFENGELLLSTTNQQGPFSKFKKFFTNVLVAPPAAPEAENFKIVLNNEDIINYFAPFTASTFKNFTEPLIIRDTRWFDRILDHGILTTYLNVQNITSLPLDYTNLPELRKFTLQSIVDSTGMLESTCPFAKINFTVDPTTPLKVKFDSTDPLDRGLNGAVYEWNFGDGTVIEDTDSKTIEHTFASANNYEVKLRVTDKVNNDFGVQAQEKAIISLISDSVLGSCGSEKGKYRLNPDGIKGGFVSNLALVEDQVYIDSTASVCGFSVVSKFSNIKSAVKITNSKLSNVQIIGSVGLNISNSNLLDSTFTSLTSGNILSSRIITSHFKSTSVVINNSYVENTTIIGLIHSSQVPGTVLSIQSSYFRNVNEVTDQPVIFIFMNSLQIKDPLNIVKGYPLEYYNPVIPPLM